MDSSQVQITATPPPVADTPDSPGPVADGSFPVVDGSSPVADAPGSPQRGPGSPRQAGVGRLIYKGLKLAADLRVTVTLFALAIVLVFAGTLAQVDGGIWNVVAKYFRSFYVWIPLQILFPRTWKVGGGFPFPGGWLLGSLLLVNLLAAHAIRFKLSWNRTGIILLHAGLIVIMLGELVTGLFAVEGSMLIFAGSSSNYVVHPRETELAIAPVSNASSISYTVVPMPLLRKPGTISDESLPFDVEIVQYMVNSRLLRTKGIEYLSPDYQDLPPAEGTENLATAGLGVKYFVAVNRPETAGVDQNKEDQAAAYLRLREKGTGRDLGTYLVAVLLQEEPQYVTVNGKKYDVRLRMKRSYKDYTIHLKEFRHDRYTGTETAKNFSSDIRLVDPSKGVDMNVLISMNAPLRYEGETFYQQSFTSGGRGTILQVVQNPAWQLPYISCCMVGLGMIIHFGMHLVTFLQRRAVI